MYKAELLRERLRVLALERIKENEQKAQIKAIRGLSAERKISGITEHCAILNPEVIRGLK